MSEKYGVCYICKKEITQKEINEGGIVLMMTPEKTRQYVHLSHPGVQEEYDKQLGVKTSPK